MQTFDYKNAQFPSFRFLSFRRKMKSQRNEMSAQLNGNGEGIEQCWGSVLKQHLLNILVDNVDKKISKPKSYPERRRTEKVSTKFCKQISR